MPLYPSNSVQTGMAVPDVPKVSSIDEFLQQRTVPNGKYVAFQDDDDVFYFMTTNENNYKTATRYRFYEDPIPKPEDNFATKQEIMDLKGDIANVQQLVQQLIDAQSNQQYTKSKHPGANGANKANVPNFTEGK